MRVWEISRKIGAPSALTMIMLRKVGVGVKSPSSWVEPTLAQTFIDFVRSF